MIELAHILWCTLWRAMNLQPYPERKNRVCLEIGSHIKGLCVKARQKDILKSKDENIVVEFSLVYTHKASVRNMQWRLYLLLKEIHNKITSKIYSYPDPLDIKGSKNFLRLPKAASQGVVAWGVGFYNDIDDVNQNTLCMTECGVTAKQLNGYQESKFEKAG